MTAALLLAGVFALSALGTGAVRRYALARRILDVPNDRSSHSAPTPRGGGIAVVAAFGLATAALAAMGRIPISLTAALLVGGALVATVGFLDDHRSLAPRWRLLAHLVAAAWAVASLGGFPPLDLPGGPVDLGVAGAILAVTGLVWLLNLYNFMDGIDGIAGVEALTVCVGAALLHLSRPDTASEWLLPATLAAAVLGFLVWNFPPARIFMGDAGSGFIGLVLGVLAVRSAALSPPWLWSWAILLGAFIVDATVTLIRRSLRRERLAEAHRSHAYQHAAVGLGAHRPVTLAVAAINLGWLLPLALAVGTGRLDGLLGTAIAYAPLVWLVLRYDAGVARRRRQ